LASVPLLPLVAAFATAVIGALFALADTAVTSLSSARLQALLETASGANKRAYERIRDEDVKLRTRYVLGRVSCTAAAGLFLHEAFEPAFPRFALYLAIISTVLLTGTLFEITTTLGRKHADQAAPAATRWLRPFEILLLPVALPLGYLAQYLSQKDGEVAQDPKVAGAEVEMLVEEVERSGLFAPEPAEMIRNVLEFADRTTRDVMIPRSKVEAIEISTPLDRVLNQVTESGHSRYPIYKEHLDNVIGLLYAKDLFKVTAPMSMPPPSSNPAATRPPRLKEIIRVPANFVAESQPLSTLLREMRGKRQHMAVVVDEFGGMSGVVTLEDVLEEIVGDIRDEHDDAPPPPPEGEEAPIQDLGDGRLVADADVSMKDLSAFLGTDLPAGRGDSLGGMLTQAIGHVPEAGTEIEKYGFQFIVREGDEKHIGKVEIVRPARRDAAAGTSAPV
jgi:CBS domain containing-hemolysin-like protein